MPTELQNATGINIITEVPDLDDGIPISGETKMYVDTEQTFRQIPLIRLYNWLKGNLTKAIYPVGSVYMSFSSTNPATLFGGTWAKVEGRFLLGSNSTYGVNSTGGEAKHTLNANEMPSHKHNTTVSTAGNHTHTPYSSSMYFSINKNIDDASSGGGIVARRRVQTVSSGGAWALTSTGQYSDITQNQNTSTTGNHTHTVTTTNTGGGAAHNNMPPYVAVNIWKRTA